MSEVVDGRYRLEELLGRGASSEVWRATDVELERPVALKLLAPGADTVRFDREARAVASLSHPNITQLFDYGEAEERPFMVLEYLPGGTLEDRLGEGPLTDDETLTVAAEVVSGLAHAHSRGVVHRDLKPSNILFDAEGHAKVADFGIARMAAGGGTITETGSLLGTAAYISPEQAEGATATPASDVYSFGVILYQMLTGRLPFEATTPMELVMQHRLAEPAPIARYRADAPPRLAAAAGAALAKRPAERPPDGNALLAALGLTRVETAAAPASPSEEETRVLPVAPQSPTPPPGPSPRTRLPLALGALLVLGLAGAGAAYELSRPTGSTPTPSFVTEDTSTKTHNRRILTAGTTIPLTTRPATTARRTTTRGTTTRERQTTNAATTTPRTTTAKTEPTTTSEATTAATTTVETTTAAPTTTTAATTTP